MPRMPFRHAALALAAALAAGALLHAAQPGASNAEVLKEVQAWRDKHEADYRREYVPLAGLFYLKPGVNTAGSGASNAIVLPKRTPPSVGRFTLENGRVRFEPDAAAKVLLNGKPLTGAVPLKSDSDEGGPDRLALGDLELWVHQSGDRRTIRMRDPQSEPAKSFTGFEWFPIDLKYRVVGRFIKDAAPRELKIPTLVGDYDVYKTEGVVEFTLNGRTLRLRPMTTRPNRFFFVFKDASSGKETYEAARFLYSDLRPDGTTILDFNEAYNPPCAFNEFTTCPIPLPENRLPIALLVGEKDYRKTR
jgi:uncharacterized protein